MLESTADDLDIAALAVGLAERSSVESLWVYNFLLHLTIHERKSQKIPVKILYSAIIVSVCVGIQK